MSDAAKPAKKHRQVVKMEAGEPPTKQRRAYGSVRPLLLESARKVFAERGFAGATTREIAAQAGATERLLFHHFGSKVRLFQAAVLEPFTELVAELTVGLSQGERRPGAELPMREIVRQLYCTLRDNRDLSLAVATAHEQGVEPDDDSLLDRIRPTMTTIHGFVAEEARVGGWREADTAVTVGNVMGMITAAAVFKDYFFAHSPDAADDEIIDELSDLIVHGLMRRHRSDTDATVHEQLDRHRVVITGPNPVAVTAAAADWTARWGSGVPISDVTWHADGPGGAEMRIYLEPVRDEGGER